LITFGGMAAVVLVVALILVLGEQGTETEETETTPHDGTMEHGIGGSDLSNGEREREPVRPGMDPASPLVWEEGELRELEPLDLPGWRVFGTVTRMNGEPAAGAEVLITMEIGHEAGPILPSAFADERGAYVLDVAVPWDRETLAPVGMIPAFLVGRARKDPYQSDRLEKECHLDLGQGTVSVRMDFILSEDVLLHGRVVDRNGQSIRHAAVYLKRAGAKADEDDEDVFTDREGRYAIELKWYSKGIHRLMALKPGLGSSPWIPVDIDPAESAKAPDLILNRFSFIQGTTEFPDGRPASGIEIFAFQESQTDQAEDSLPFDRDELCRFAQQGTAEGGTGLNCGWALSAGDGRFFMEGLKPGRYDLLPDLLLDPMNEIRVACRTGDRDVRIVLPVHMLDVLLIDENDWPIPHASLDLEFDGQRISREVVNGRIREQVEPGEVLLEARAAGGLIGRRGLLVQAEQYELSAELVLAEASKGHLRIFPIDSKGAIQDSLDGLEFYLENEQGRIDVDLAGKPSRTSAGIRVTLDTGVYQPYMEYDNHDEFSPTEFRLPAILEEVKVDPGMETLLDLPIRKGGRISLRYHAGNEAKGRVERIKAFPKDGKESTTLTLFLTEGRERPLLFTSMDPGKTYLCAELLEPGAYSLQMEVDGHGAIESEFYISPGQVTPLDLWIEAKRE
jgi:hypothetical protein